MPNKKWLISTSNVLVLCFFSLTGSGCKTERSEQAASALASAVQKISTPKVEGQWDIFMLPPETTLRQIAEFSIECDAIQIPDGIDLSKATVDFTSDPKNDQDLRRELSLIRQSASEMMAFHICDIQAKLKKASVNIDLIENGKPKIPGDILTGVKRFRSFILAQKKVSVMRRFSLSSLKSKVDQESSNIGEQSQTALSLGVNPQGAVGARPSTSCPVSRPASSNTESFLAIRPCTQTPSGEIPENSVVSKAIVDQTPYFKDFYPYQQRKNHVIPEGNDPLVPWTRGANDTAVQGSVRNLFNASRAVFDTAEKALLDDSLFTTSFTGLHQENRKLIRQMILRYNLGIKTNQDQFKLSPLARKGAGMSNDQKEIKYFTDIDLNEYLKSIQYDQTIRNVAIGALGSSVFGAIFTNIAGGARLNFALKGIAFVGFETVFSLAAIILGTKQMYLMHRFYSYMSAIRREKLSKSQEFNPDTAASHFIPEQVIYGYHIDRLKTSSMLIGATAGFFIRLLTDRDRLARVIIASHRTISAQLRHGGSTSTKLLGKAVAKAAILVNQILVSKGGLSRMIPKFFAKKVDEFLKNRNNLKISDKFKKKVGRVASALDFLTTGVGMWAVISFQLDITRRTISDVFLSPGENFYLALTEGNFLGLKEAPKNVIERSFEYGTHQVFFPLCALMSRAHFEMGSTTAELYAERKNACLAYLSVLTNTPSNQVPEKYSALVALLNNVGTAGDNLKYSSKGFNKKLQDLIAQAAAYPPSFKVIWLAGLKAIFRMSRIPAFYWKTQKDILTYKLSDLAQRMGNSSSEIMNLERLSYVIDLLAVESYKKKINSSESVHSIKIKGADSQPYKAFLLYFKYQFRKSLERYQKYQELFERKNSVADPGWLEEILGKVLLIFADSEPVLSAPDEVQGIINAH